MKLKRFMIAKSHNEHGLSVSSYFPSSRGALYGIGPSSLYEVIPGNRVGFAGEWPVTTYRTQESFQRWRHLGAILRLTPQDLRLAVNSTAPGCSLSGDRLHPSRFLPQGIY